LNDAPWRAIRDRNVTHILAVWHGSMLPAIWAHRGEGLVALVSEHRDGEIIARIIAGLGYETARGSSTRGGARALLEVMRVLEAGKPVAFTPDGPQGPRHVMHAGLAAAARRSGVPVVLIGMATTRAWRFRSWDQFTLPKPFARVFLGYSDPVSVANDADVNAETARLESAMNTAVALAESQLANG
jgi:lysophospholipid acyltransferase (LPLAT)-like uncharacterized protein